MPDDAVLEVRVSNDMREIPGIADKIDAFCAARGMGPVVAYAANLSIDEVLTNTISYGYQDEARHDIDIALHFDGNRLVVVIRDDAAPFDPTLAAEPDTGAALADRPIGGLGLFLVKQMMDDVAYRHENGFNVMTLTKTVAAPAS